MTIFSCGPQTPRRPKEPPWWGPLSSPCLHRQKAPAEEPRLRKASNILPLTSKLKISLSQRAGNLEQLFGQDCQAILQSGTHRLVYLFDQDCSQDCQAILQSWSPQGKLVGEQVGQVGQGGSKIAKQSCNLGLHKCTLVGKQVGQVGQGGGARLLGSLAPPRLAKDCQDGSAQ